MLKDYEKRDLQRALELLMKQDKDVGCSLATSEILKKYSFTGIREELDRRMLSQQVVSLKSKPEKEPQTIMNKAFGLIDEQFSSVTDKYDLLASIKWALEDMQTFRLLTEEECLIFLMSLLSEFIDIDRNKRELL
jgi:hypothetical protein